MTIKIGDHLPKVTLKTLGIQGPQDVVTTDLFGNKKAVLFAVPGAFTGTCSLKHLPGFVKEADELKALGVELIVCLAVNDVFVLDAWAKSQGIKDEVKMVSDGNADFTKAVGLTLDVSAAGMGLRSKRYAMILDHGKVQQLFVEEKPGEAILSGAEHVLSYLKENA